MSHQRILLTLLALLAGAAGAQEVPLGRKVRATVQGSNRPVTGILTSATADSWTIVAPGGAATPVALSGVREVRVSEGVSRRRGRRVGAKLGALIGLGVGAVTGLAIAAEECAACGATFMAIMGGGTMWIPGMVIGGAIGAEEWRPIPLPPRPGSDPARPRSSGGNPTPRIP